jgi:uncharacterized protein (TIGR03435 family)
MPTICAAQLPLPDAGAAVDSTLQFEVASIRRYDTSGGPSLMRMRMLPGQFEAVGVPARLLLRQVLRVPDGQMIGAPAWTDRDLYTLVATAPAGAPPNAGPTMLLNLLKDRFKLATHTETREMPIYGLILARDDGQLGRGLKPSSPECQTEMAAFRAGRSSASGPGPAALPAPRDFNNPSCGSSNRSRGMFKGGGMWLGGLAQVLTSLTGRPVVDKTRLTGVYDVSLEYDPDSTSGTAPLPGITPAAGNPGAPNIYTAVQEQLGLKLDNQRGPVDVIVIDRIEKPTVD